MTIQKTDGRVTWTFFIRGYLRSAELNMEEVIKFLKKYPSRSPKTAKDMGSKFSSNHGVYLTYVSNLWIPTIFLIRHSIELILKSISVRMYSQFIKTHNIKDLLESFDKKDKQNRFLSEDIRVFSAICEKYFFYKCFPKNITNDPQYIDSLNVLFRYPENYLKSFKNNSLVRVNDFTYFNNMKITEARKFLRDIEKLKDLAGILESTPDHIESNEKLGISVSETKKRIREIRKERRERAKNRSSYSW